MPARNVGRQVYMLPTQYELLRYSVSRRQLRNYSIHVLDTCSKDTRPKKRNIFSLLLPPLTSRCRTFCCNPFRAARTALLLCVSLMLRCVTGTLTAHITGANKKDPPLGPKTGEGGGAEQERTAGPHWNLRRVFFFFFCCCDDDNRRAELFLHLHCCIVTESRSECSLICWGEDTLLLAGARKLERRQCCFQVAIHRSTDLDPSPHGCVLSLSLG